MCVMYGCIDSITKTNVFCSFLSTRLCAYVLCIALHCHWPVGCLTLTTFALQLPTHLLFLYYHVHISTKYLCYTRYLLLSFIVPCDINVMTAEYIIVPCHLSAVHCTLLDERTG